METCNATLAALSEPGSKLDGEPPQFAVIHKDIMTLLAFVYAAATKISLTLKPSSPTYSGALGPLKDMSEHTSALLHCVNLLSDDIHGATLKQETRSLVQDIIQSIRAFLSAFLLDSGREEDEHLVRIGVLHNQIDKARSLDGLSIDNLAAVRKLWVQDADSLEDGLREVNEMIENGESNDQSDDSDADDEDDDGWAELGLGSDKKLDSDELERAKKVEPLLSRHLFRNLMFCF